MPAQYQKIKLKNGATLVMESNAHVRSCSIGVWLRIGSRYESANLNGVSHFLEHMVFKGTAKRNSLEIATVLESLGGELNAFTDREVTCYHATVLSEHVAIALDVLSDVTLNPIFPKNEIELEKKVLLQELAMVDESPDDKVYEHFFKGIWKEQPLGQPIIGTKATITSFNQAIARKFFEKHYHPQNMVISVAGNIDPKQITELCEKLFDSGNRAFSPSIRSYDVEYYQAHKKAVLATDQLHLVVGFEGLSVDDPDRFNAIALNFYFGGGMSSRLFQEIREKAGLAYTVECDFIPFSGAGACAIYLALQPKSLNKSLGILAKEIETVVNKPISKKSLELVKSQIKGSVFLSAESTEARQESLGRNEISFGKHITPEEIVRLIDECTVESVQQVAQRIFVPEKESVITLSRAKPKMRKVSVFA